MRYLLFLLLLRGWEDSWWHKLLKSPGMNVQGCPEELLFSQLLAQSHTESSVGDEGSVQDM